VKYELRKIGDPRFVHCVDNTSLQPRLSSFKKHLKKKTDMFKKKAKKIRKKLKSVVKELQLHVTA
jgi:hypothetical protein